MNRIYKLVLFVEVSARSGSVLSMLVKINVITDIKIFVQALSIGVGAFICSVADGHAWHPEPHAPGHARDPAANPSPGADLTQCRYARPGHLPRPELGHPGAR